MTGLSLNEITDINRRMIATALARPKKATPEESIRSEEQKRREEAKSEASPKAKSVPRKSTIRKERE